jgi:predicted phosphodiesterase
MQLIEKIIPFTGDPVFEIYGIGDGHEGTVHHDAKRFQRYIDAVASDPYTYWVALGDHAECIVPSDPRFEPSEVDPIFYSHIGTLARAQSDRYIETVRPIKDKCLGVIEGNHEYQIRRRHYIDLARDAASQLEVPYLSDCAIIRFSFQLVGEDGKRQKSCLRTLFLSHGAGGGRKGGSTSNRLEDLMGEWDCDMFMFGHTHKRVTTRRVRLGVTDHGKPHMTVKEQVGASSGSFYWTYTEGHSSYGQRQLMPPVPLGSVRFRIRPLTGELEVVN